MGHQYTPNPLAPFPTSIYIPDDGDADQAADFDPAYEALADAVANVRKDLYSKRLIGVHERSFVGTKIWTVTAYNGADGDLLIDLSGNGYQTGDIFDISVSLVAYVVTSSNPLGSLKIFCGEDSINPTIVTPRALDVGGERAGFGPSTYGLSQGWPVTLSGRVTKSAYPGDLMTFVLTGKSSVSGQGVSDQDTLGAGATVDVSVRVWRVTP